MLNERIDLGPYYHACFYYSSSNKEDRGLINKIDRYIINEYVTVIFWKDGRKTMARLDSEDKFDKEIGFMLAVYRYLMLYVANPTYSKTELKKRLDCIKASKLYDYLFIAFNKFTFKDTNKSKKYLEELKVEENKKKNKKLVEHRLDKRVIVKKTREIYPTYEKWIDKYFPQYKKQWVDGDNIIYRNKIYRLIGKANHGIMDANLALIQDLDTDQVYIIDDIGIKEIEVI